MSLATLRTHVWKGGNDVVLHYKSNGRRELRPFKPATPEPQPEAESADAEAEPAAAAPESADTTAAPTAP